MKKQVFTLAAGILTGGFPLVSQGIAQSEPVQKQPNFVIIFTDDLGYGDLSCFGHPTIRTPNLDQMAVEGQKWTSFYVAAPVCTPSRAALLTGRYPVRNGMCSDQRGVLFPDSDGGLPPEEITIARALKDVGYRTAAIGKWHLGHKSPYLPTDHGFESYFGIPYSNDMDKVIKEDYFKLAAEERYEAYNVPLMRNTAIVERPANQTTITRRYTEEAISRIREFRNEQFLVYLAHSLPHIPLFRSPAFKDRSPHGIYGDVVEEIDWSVGEIVKTLRDLGIAGNTLVIFTSDNGPWLPYKTHGGSAGLLREGKGSTWEGGMRVPMVAWWPGTLKPGIVTDMGSTLDLFPTLISLAGGKVPTDRIYDGYDLTALLAGKGKNIRKEMFYYQGEQLYAVRLGEYKAHFETKILYTGQKESDKHDPPLLFQLEHDPSEKFDISGQHPEIIEKILELAKRHKSTLTPVENQLVKRIKTD